MQIEKNKKINEAIDLLIKGGVDLKTVLSQNGLIKELTKGILERALHADERTLELPMTNIKITHF
ncbi:hypothetical protein [Rickettsia endosymbiont of Urophora cardui]|uniref:hypothetical protein n=1 Tax=Rickettsia endosymbiont of Urophora cardui TaxID=3066265 RepID=UPI00313F23C4